MSIPILQMKKWRPKGMRELPNVIQLASGHLSAQYSHGPSSLLQGATDEIGLRCQRHSDIAGLWLRALMWLCARLFTAASFTRARRWKQPKGTLIDEQTACGIYMQWNMSQPLKRKNFPHGPMAKTLRSQSSDMGSIPDQRMPQLRVHKPQLKIPCATPKTQQSQVNRNKQDFPGGPSG